MDEHSTTTGTPAAQELLTCRRCGRSLPKESFELYRSGTRRKVCRQCKYQLYGIKAKRKWYLCHQLS